VGSLNGGGATSTGLAEWILYGIQSSITITPDGQVGIGVTNPTQQLEVAGNAIIYGQMTGGANLHVAGSIFARDGLYRTKSKYLTGSFTANTWNNVFTGAVDTDIPSGVYILKVYCETWAAGGNMYYETHSGMFTWYSEGTNSGNVDSITTHRAGHAPNAEIVSFRTARNGSGYFLALQITSNYTWGLDSTSGKTVLAEVTRIA
jgi:hypothetical protein